MDIPHNLIPGKFLYIIGVVDCPSGVPYSNWKPGTSYGDPSPTNEHNSTSREPICFGFFAHFSLIQNTNVLKISYGERDNLPYDDLNHIKYNLFEEVEYSSGATSKLYSLNVSRIKIYYTNTGADIQVGDYLAQKTFDYFSQEEWQPNHSYKEMDTIRSSYEMDVEGEIVEMPLLVTCKTPYVSSALVDKPIFAPATTPIPENVNEWVVTDNANPYDPNEFLSWTVRPYENDTASDSVVRNYVFGEVVEVGSGYMVVEQYNMPPDRTIEDIRETNDDGEYINPNHEPIVDELINIEKGGMLEDFMIQDLMEQFTIKKLNVRDTIKIVFEPDPPLDPPPAEPDYIIIPNPNQIFASATNIEYYGDLHDSSIEGTPVVGDTVSQNGNTIGIITEVNSDVNACRNCSYKKACLSFNRYIHPGNVDYINPTRLNFHKPRKVSTIRFLIRYIKDN